VVSLSELLDHLPVKRRDIVGLAAGDQAAVGDDFKDEFVICEAYRRG